MRARSLLSRRSVALVAIVASLPLGGRALAQDSGGIDTTRQQLEKVRQQRANAAAKVDGLKGDQTEVSKALDALDDNVRGQQAAYANAIRKADDAAAELRVAEQQVTDQRAKVDELAVSARKAALKAYVHPPDDLTESIAAGVAPSEAVVKRVLAGLQSSASVDVLDALGKAQEDLERAQATAQRASDKASRQRDTAGQRLTKLQDALGQQKVLLDRVDDRLDDALGESAALEQLDSQLSATLWRQQADLAARAAAARALFERAGGSSDDGRSFDVGDSVIVTVQGVRVAASIAAQVDAMFNAAAAVGLDLGGSGYRSPAAQIAMRRSHCGSSSYAIYRMPPSRCRPPAARPGRSMHEQGLAIDVTCQGALITSRGNRCFVWLARNASRYGFYNLPSEPWHWSVNGR